MHSKGWKLYWVLVVTTVLNYLVMILWSLPQISRMAGGLVPFDMRPAGYSFQEAKQFLIALDKPTTDFYLNTQHMLDLFYPTLMAITVAIALIHLLPRYWGGGFALLALMAGVFDHLENYAVRQMLLSGPVALNEEMVSTANNWTLAKSISTSIAVSVLLIVLGIKAVLWVKARAC